MAGLLDALLAAPEADRAAVEALGPEGAAAVLYDWAGVWARPQQLPPPGDWRVWLVMTGRGWGKTRTGAEWVRAQVEAGRCGRLALVAPTAADARDVLVEGESGVLAVCPPWDRPLYEPSKRRLTWKNVAGGINTRRAGGRDQGEGNGHGGERGRGHQVRIGTAGIHGTGRILPGGRRGQVRATLAAWWRGPSSTRPTAPGSTSFASPT